MSITLHPHCVGAWLGAATLVVGCAASTAAPKSPGNEPSTTTATSTALDQPTTQVTANPVAECDLYCERAQVVKRPSDEPDYHAQATASANRVLDAMHADLLACYKKRVAVNPAAHGFITIDVVVGPDGHVQNVETTGGAILGEGTMSCIVERVKKGTFDKPHGGGTMRVHVPFSLRKTAPGDDTY